MEIKIRWLNKEIGKICAKRDHSILLQKDLQLSARLAELQVEIDRVKQTLAEAHIEMLLKNFHSKSVNNYRTCIIGGN